MGMTVDMSRKESATGSVHKMPADFRNAIESDSIVKDAWADITPLARNEWICWVTSAKKDETRARRIIVGLDKMRKACAALVVGLVVLIVEMIFRTDRVLKKAKPSPCLRRGPALSHGRGKEEEHQLYPPAEK